MAREWRASRSVYERPVLGCFKDAPNFAAIDFSTTGAIRRRGAVREQGLHPPARAPADRCADYARARLTLGGCAQDRREQPVVRRRDRQRAEGMRAAWIQPAAVKARRIPGAASVLQSDSLKSYSALNCLNTATCRSVGVAFLPRLVMVLRPNPEQDRIQLPNGG